MFVKRMSVVWFVVAGLCLAFAFSSPRAAGSSETADRYVVKPGDTLWEIAADRYDGDPRGTVWRLQELNDLRSPALVPGMVLYLPS
jgi:nucleoid-associated protein YgaU